MRTLVLLNLSLMAFSVMGGKKKFQRLDMERYLKLNEQIEYLKQLSEWAGPSFNLTVVGNTYIKGKPWQNDLYLVEIGSDSDPVLFFDCGIHAREWISSATCLYLIENLATQFKEANSTDKKPIHNYQWVFMPMLNPDGYNQSHAEDRFWRKNVRPFSAMNISHKSEKVCRCTENPDDCRGVDLNRNFPSGWGKGNKRFQIESSYPCMEIYKGEEPLSEPETKTMHEQVSLRVDKILGAFSVHCYGMEIYYPKGWLKEKDKNQINSEQREKLEDFANYFNKFLDFGIGSVDALLGTTFLEGGSSDDYYFSHMNISYSYTIELNPHTDDYDTGFELPPEEILSVGNKTWTAIQRMAEKFDMLNESC